MQGSLVYSDTAVASTDGSISVGHHTDYIAFWNKNSATDAVVKLNNQFSVLIPHTPTTAAGTYTKIYGDYTKFEVITTSVELSVFAVGWFCINYIINV